MGIQETAIRHALQFLRTDQNTDGSWEEDDDLVEIAPFWVKPGDLSTRLYLTANCGFWLGVLAPGGEAVIGAATCLQAHLKENGRLLSFLQAQWLACGLWHRLGLNAPSAKILAYYQTRYSDLEAGNLAWMMNTLIIAGLPSGTPLVRNSADRLVGLQAADGHWSGEDASQDVHTTLVALRALLFMGDH